MCLLKKELESEPVNGEGRESGLKRFRETIDEILESTTGLVRLDFTKEGPGRAERIAKAYGEMTADAERMSPATRNLLGEMSEKGSTKGHFFRGVE